MTLREIAEALKKEFPKEYASFTIDVNVYPRPGIAGLIPEKDSHVEMEISIYTEKTKHVQGTSFEDCLRQIRERLDPPVLDIDKEVPTIDREE
jgi:hypothetical protein